MSKVNNKDTITRLIVNFQQVNAGWGKSFSIVLKIWQKSSIFSNVTDSNNFSKVSLHFQKVNFSREVFQTYSELSTFCVMQ